MKPMTLEQVARATGGRIVGAPATPLVVDAVATDTRTLATNGARVLFVALQGERFDGHDHVAVAADAGVGVVLV